MALLRVNQATRSPERILIYGDPKSGKSRLATSLPIRHFGDIIYFAADPGSESLSSVLPQHLPHIHIVKPGPGGPGGAYDPDQDAFLFALNDWKKEIPTAGTIVWDTMTATSLDILSHLADTGAFSESKHIQIGKGKAPQNIPMQGDYMATHNRISRLLEFLFRQPLHLIIVCHATYDESRMGEGLEGGPATAGKATVRSFPGRFDTVLHTVRRSTGGKQNTPNTMTYTVFSERHSIWSAGIRSGHENNPMPIFELGPDPAPFWEAFLLNFRKDTNE